MAPLLSLAHAIRTEKPCAQARDIKRLQQKAIALVNARRVPASLQDTLMSGVNALAEQTPVCLPPVPSTPAPAIVPTPPKHGHGHEHHGHGKGHGEDG